MRISDWSSDVCSSDLVFTAGIAVTILASQLKDLFGLRLETAEPGPVVPKLLVLAHAAPSASPAAFGLALAVIAIALVIQRRRPLWPAMLIGVAAASALAAAVHLPVETVGRSEEHPSELQSLMRNSYA